VLKNRKGEKTMGEPVHLIPCVVPEREYQARRVIEKMTSESWAKSVQQTIQEGAQAPDVTGYVPDATYLASYSKWKDEPFGAANTMEHSACIVFVVKHILDFYGVRTSVLALKDLIVERGYRAWKFEKASKTFYTAKATLKEAMEVLPEGTNREEITTMEQAYEILGKPSGIGGVHVLLDNLVGGYGRRRPVEETRLLSVDEVYQELKAGRMVPMRVDNSKYWQDPTKREGHFVLLVAVHNQEALVIDSSVGERKLPIHQLLQATTVAWKVCPKR